MKSILKPIVVLTLISVIAAALLGGTYEATKPLIDAAEKAATAQAMQQVLPQATSLEEFEMDEIENLQLAARDAGGAGYAFKVTDKGFGGQITVMVGIDLDGKMTGIQLVEHSETPGLGSKAGQPSFTDKFIGVDEGGLSGVDTISGATVTSSAVKRCAATAYEAFNSLEGGSQA